MQQDTRADRVPSRHGIAQRWRHRRSRYRRRDIYLRALAALAAADMIVPQRDGSEGRMPTNSTRSNQCGHTERSPVAGPG